MHPNKIFRETDETRSKEFMAEQSFGMFIVQSSIPLISHVPFIFDPKTLYCETHLVRSNPIARKLAEEEVSAVLVVQGPQSYISPDWYGIDDQVPTCNYVAVHAMGRLSRLPQDKLFDVLDRQSGYFEDRLAPKPAWTMDKLHEETKVRLMRQIVPVRFDISEVQSTWKLGQNKPDDARLGAARGVREAQLNEHAQSLSDLMENLPSIDNSK